MALNTRISSATDLITKAAAIAVANAIGRMCNDGQLVIYSGEVPDSCDAPLTNNEILVTLALGQMAFKYSYDGVINANEITDGVALANGTPTYFRVFTDGGVPVYDGTVGTADCNLILPVAHIQAGVTVGCSSLTFSADFSTITQ